VFLAAMNFEEAWKRAEERAVRAEARAEAAERQVVHLTRLVERLMAHLGVPSEEVQEAVTHGRPVAASPAPPAETRPKPSRREGHGRKVLPEALPRDVREHRPKICASCGATDFRDIGQETAELLDFVPATVRVRRVVRWTCACKRCNTLITAEAPPEPIAKGKCTAAFLAWVIHSKYALHLPLERLKSELRRQGVDVTVSTMCGWLEQASFLLEPLFRRQKELLLASGVVQTDGTGLQVLRKGLDRAHLGQIAVYCSPTFALYEYTPSKEGKHAEAFLDGFKGTVVADASSTFDRLFKSGEILEAGCWAHARRKFEETVDHTPAAHEALTWIGHFYDLERDARQRNLEGGERLLWRQSRVRPVLEDFRVWLEDQAQAALPKSSFGKAITYARKHWGALTRFLVDPRLPPDNNLSERCLRAIAVGRNNWMFAGSDEGAQRAAILFSMVQTCKLNDVDPLAWLTHVLPQLAVHPDNRRKGGSGLDDLLPHLWKPVA